MDQGFTGRHVVVTGGTGALGSTLVSRLVEAGAQCHVPCFHLKELERFGLREHRGVHLQAGIDLRSEASAEAFYATVPAGSLWASFHVAGGFSMGPLEQVSAQTFIDLMQMNVLTSFLCSREAVKRMGGAGRIVNVSARPALEPRQGAGMAPYTAAKAAVAALTISLAAELAPRGVLVNAVAPSILDTPANRRAMPGADYSAWPTCDQVASAMLTLASPSNTVMSGAIVPVYARA